MDKKEDKFDKFDEMGQSDEGKLEWEKINYEIDIWFSCKNLKSTPLIPHSWEKFVLGDTPKTPGRSHLLHLFAVRPYLANIVQLGIPVGS